jgi:hypothetical protein
MLLKVKDLACYAVVRTVKEKGELKMRREFRKLLKTHIEKVPVFRLSIMLKKTNELNHSLHYVDEKKGS